MPTIPTRRDANGISSRSQPPQVSLTTPVSVAPKSTKPRKLLVGRMKSLIPVRKSSRRKNPAPRANCTSFGEPRVVHVHPTQNNDYCESCKGLGTFLCCDSCPRSFHLTCLNPPMDQDSIPENEWHCNSCSPLPLPKGYRRDGLFGNILEVIHCTNPISFEIPEEIKSCFRGVDTNEYGEFVDTTLLVNPKNKMLTIKSGWTRVLDLREKDAIVLCYYCRLSGLRGPIIACDYCSLYWHMDCLTPPLAVPPPPHLKWMCPNHADHLLPKARYGLLDIDAQEDAHLGLIPSLMNSLPVDEEQIMSSFLERMQRKKKIDRFSHFLREAETDIFAKLLDPKTLLSNHTAV
ncbi:hypothetical protein DSO57_1019397 [Entomophthora muscae]|uniref:Uncharacterized protein n=1 Tax=Entomophthora muscae TaxID=34485 RepID=A0ACC2UCY7_9FUNG|nr:hypothetical protein DSO57_1019397 [Entomophthora muscae]